MIAVGLLMSLAPQPRDVHLPRQSGQEPSGNRGTVEAVQITGQQFVLFISSWGSSLICYAAMLGLILIVALPDIRAEHFGGGAIAPSCSDCS